MMSPAPASLTLRVVVPVAVTLILLIAGLITTMARVSIHDARANLAERANLTVSMLSNGIAPLVWALDLVNIERELAALKADPDYAGSVVWDDLDKVIAQDGRTDSAASDIVHETTTISYTDDAGKFHQLGRVMVSLQTDRAEAKMMGRLWRIALGGLAALLAICAVLVYIARGLIQPINALTATMTGLAGGDTSLPVPARDRHDEIGRMAAATEIFRQNAMALRTSLVERDRVSEQLRRLADTLEVQVRERTAEAYAAKDRAETALEELRCAQASLVQAEKMASLAQLVAGIAHEINTPIGVALTAASYFDRNTADLKARFDSGLLKKADLAAYLTSTTEAASFIASNLARAADLIQSFKRVAVDQTSETRRTFDLSEYLGEIIQSLRPVLKKVPHVVEVACAKDITIDSYPGALFQVITNFVMNSLHHAFDTNMVGHIRIGVQDQMDKVVIEYSDDGKGIPPDHLERIFEPFFTTARSRGGSGLGLHIVYNLVTTTLKGDIACQSKPGEGTRMIVTLPKVVG
jgi:signal transduction histidine kinase